MSSVTASQQASAQLHLERASEWRTVRINGVRYVVLPSGRSGHVYHVRADGRGCSCRFYATTQRTCAHMHALRLHNERGGATATTWRHCERGCGAMLAPEHLGRLCNHCAERALKGTYVSVEPFHLFRYVDEQAFRFNARKVNDQGRFVQVSGQVVGKRLTYKNLTGKGSGSIEANA